MLKLLKKHQIIGENKNFKPAIILLENGKYFIGNSFGADGEKVGELVFNTSLTGYQEILTDPSYKSQFVLMTYTEIGNYGVNDEDLESKKVWVEGFIVREYSKNYHNYRAKDSLNNFLKKYNVLGIENVDTRALTRMTRIEGSLKAIISTLDFNIKSLKNKLKKWEGIVGVDNVKYVTSDKVWLSNFFDTKKDYKVVVIDCGVKYNILRLLECYGLQPIIVTAFYDYKEILKLKPDGILISNGPGDPAAVVYVIKNVSELLNFNIPTFGICLGHQILALASGGKTYKLKFGHHGGNHPVKELKTGKVDITVQNHNFCVDIKSLSGEVDLTHINLNDNTCEGLKFKKIPVFSVQFHPEASPGPYDAMSIFKDFRILIEKYAKKKRY